MVIEDKHHMTEVNFRYISNVEPEHDANMIHIFLAAH
jgi:hypothetical protein